MNIEDLQDVINYGNIAVLEGIIMSYNIYSINTGEDVTEAITALEDEITAVRRLINTPIIKNKKKE